ncbi:hypothetical protein BY458DRAFT_77041 [Sporodiniella umbellata]|nr:hypothetical protein BY458DRAFT_77041 [Sporodiniella umbellata]
MSIHNKVLSFEAPNLYQTSLQLTTETDLHSWWNTVVDIFSNTSFHATRITLSVPQDSNDPHSGPWGLKAVYNKTGSISQEAEDGEPSEGRHNTENSSDYFLHLRPTDETGPRHIPWCFEKLQPFESEPQPLITNLSVQKIIKRNTVIALSREYRIKSSPSNTSTRKKYGNDECNLDLFKKALLDRKNAKINPYITATRKRAPWNVPVITAPYLSHEGEILVDGSSCMDTSEEIDTDLNVRSNNISTIIQDYDEYEQQQPSPWSQSPAPSPAIMDLEVNPFFQSPPDIDDEAFQPASPETYYDRGSAPFPPPLSNVHSIVHVPLFHPSNITLSQSFTSSTKHSSHPAPIAILSFLVPIVPYPQALLTSLSSLSPFIAASFINAMQNFSIKKQTRLFKQYASTSTNLPKQDKTKTRHSSLPSIIQRGGYFDDIYDDEDNDEDEDKNSTDFSNVTPTVSKRPRHLGSMSNFSRCSIETVTKESTVGNNEISLSPSSAAVIEGWGAISPTTGLPISASIPPHAMCSDKQCLVHPELIEVSHPSFSNTQHVPKMDDTDYFSSSTPDSKNPKYRILKRSKKTKPKRYKRQSRKNPDCNTLRHHVRKNDKATDNFFVVPKSSLLRLIIDGIPIHVFTCSPTSGQVTWVNNRCLQYTGDSLEELLGPKWLSHMHPDDQPECKKAWKTSFEKGNGFAGEYRLRRFDGLYRCFLWRIVPLRDLKGEIIHWFGTCTDTHDQKVAKESNMRQLEIENNEKKYRLLAEAIPQIVFTFSPNVGLTYTNGKWASYSGKSSEQTMRLGFMSCVHPEDRAKLQLPTTSNQTNEAGISWQTEVRLLSYKDEYKWFLIKCVSVEEIDTNGVRWFGTCTDINDHIILERKLKEAHDAAQRSTESKTRFLSNMSHEIRTPLIGITGMLNFLLDTELTEEQTDYVHIIQQSAESLLVVINDILDLSKVEAGMMKLEREPFNLITMIEDTNELMSTLAIQKNLELSFWIDDDIPNVIVGDRVRLRQVLLNLIGNAIKFTSEGEIFTKCTIENIDIEKSELVLIFEVVDTGTGFDATDEAVMFKPFSQVDSSSTRKHGGSGLGLVISRQLIELHGGKIGCKSQKNKGSVFYFTVKFDIPASSIQPQPQTPKNETKQDPFFRTHGYNNTAMLKQQEQEIDSPINFINRDPSAKNKSCPEPSIVAHSKKHSQLLEATTVTNSAEILQNVLMSKTVSMQLKPPPFRKNSSTLTMPTFPGKREHNAASEEPLVPSLGIALNGSSSAYQPTISPCAISYTPLIQVLIISQWKMSRESLVKHVTSILSKLTTAKSENMTHFRIETVTNQTEAIAKLIDTSSLRYDYIMINLPSEKHILSLTSIICGSLQQRSANVLITTTPMQRSLITDMAKGKEEKIVPENCGFVFKPIKRTKLQWYFGAKQEQYKPKDLYTNQTPNNDVPVSVKTPDTPYKRAATQKEVFERMAADVGGKGYKVLLVEDNLVNQKVLKKYLQRVGLDVDVAIHGEECTDLFFNNPKGYYNLILCDLFMPVKDGYKATQEIREWEKKNLEKNEKSIPIIALSANVMSDVAEKCLECGFSTYISKPANFAVLGSAIRDFLLD